MSKSLIYNDGKRFKECSTVDNDDKKTLNPVYQEIASVLGIDAAMEIHRLFKGQQISFPVRLYTKDTLHKTIKAEYDGTNIRALASKYGYSEKTIRRVLKEEE
ncbi:MAG: Mor transcription activator family protein [Clostridia bacterium]|nr:Mor transcription activator family protein [Clostridia bacterium]